MEHNLIGWMMVRSETELIAYPSYPGCLIGIFQQRILGSDFGPSTFLNIEK